MWPNFDGKPYTRDQLAAHINALDFSAWRRKDGSKSKPLFIVLHNTSEPTIKLWLSWPPQKRQDYIHNMQPYYADMGWQGGTHCSCFNSDAIGIEMVGEFNVEPFDNGPGALVRDNAVFLLALLHNKLGLDPANYAYGKRGLHFHIECKADNHDCPGKFVHKADVIARVQAEMARLKGATPAAPAPSQPTPSAPVPAPSDAMPVLRQGMTGDAVIELQQLLVIADDGIFGAATKAAVVAYQRARGLMADGIVGNRTWASLQGAAPVVAPPQPQSVPTSGREVLFVARGKMSTFGGPNDHGMSSIEGLALFANEAEMQRHGLGSYLISANNAGASGLGRRLLTSAFYVACRWNTHDYPALRDALAHVANPKTGKSELARPMDWGPNVATGRIADLSPGLAAALGLATDDECSVTVYRDGK